MKKEQLFRLSDGTIATLEMQSAGQVLANHHLEPGGNAQMFWTQDVLRRIIRYMPMRSGMTVKVTIAQTNIRHPYIVTDTPYAQYLYHGISASGKPLHYTHINKAAGPYWDRALVAAEGAALAADLQRYINRGAK